MKYDHYSDPSIAVAVDLINDFGTVPLDSAGHGDKPLGDPAAFLRGHGLDDTGVTQADAPAAQDLADRLHEALNTDDPARVVDVVNGVLADANAVPQISSHDGQPWHLHYHAAGAAPLDQFGRHRRDGPRHRAVHQRHQPLRALRWHRVPRRLRRHVAQQPTTILQRRLRQPRPRHRTPRAPAGGRAHELTGRGVAVSDIRHLGPDGWQPGTHPDRADYGSFADFSDPDGNTWVLQEARRGDATA